MQPWLATCEFGAIKVLLPLALPHCSLDGFQWTNRLAHHASVRVVLLHVVNLNISALDNRVYDELAHDARWRMQRLSEYLHPSISRQLRVRMGDVAEEVIAEAKAVDSQFVVLTSRRSGRAARTASFWRFFRDRGTQNLGLNLARETDCSVVILPAKSCFDCESVWGRPPTRDDQRLSPELRQDNRLVANGACWAASGR